MTTGERMRRARERLGKSQKGIADELELTQPTVQAWESGRTYPRTENLRRVAKAYGLRPVELIPDEGERAA